MRNASRRASGSAATSTPATSMLPAVGRAMPAIRLSRVVLPEPLRPRSAVHPPAGTVSPAMSRTGSGVAPARA
jgi:hypothetical protein